MGRASPSRIQRRAWAALAACAVFLALAATGSLLAQEGLDPRLVAKGEGPSGLKWTGGNAESPLMHPGKSCIACHSAGGGPAFLVAGTVYTKANELDDWFGVEGVSVNITDAKGAVTRLVSNKAGNFMLQSRGAAIAMPYKASLVKGSAERRMFSPQGTGDCMACHTATGANGAPGRIRAP